MVSDSSGLIVMLISHGPTGGGFAEDGMSWFIILANCLNVMTIGSSDDTGLSSDRAAVAGITTSHLQAAAD